MLTETKKNAFRELAAKGYGDDAVYDIGSNLWIVFRLSSFEIHVKSVSNKYADVKVVKTN